MKNVSEYVVLAKVKLGDPYMSDRELGEHLGGYSSSMISDARYGRMSDPLAMKLAELLGLEPGEVLYAARCAREKDPKVRQHLESWGQKVGKALAARTLRIVGAAALALQLVMPAPEAHAVGGAGRF